MNRRDPTKTGVVRRAFQADMQRRWRQVEHAVKGAVHGDFFRVAQTSTSAVGHSGAAVAAVDSWIGTVLDTHFPVGYGDPGGISGDYVRSGYSSGVERSRSLLRRDDLHGNVAAHELLHTSAEVEMNGIKYAVRQKVMRDVALGMSRGLSSADIGRGIMDAVRRVGHLRTRLLADYMITRAHAEGTLDALQEGGVRSIALETEHLPPPHKHRRKLHDAYNPDQPRVPAGSPEGGQWASATTQQFVELGYQQRGKPENAMLAVQETMGGGVLNPVVEHAGDIIHRMTHMLKYGLQHEGREYALNKAERVLRYFQHPYGFEREMEENIRSNARYRNVSEEQFREQVYGALRKFGEEHAKLPAYNPTHALVHSVNVAIGNRDWYEAKRNLEKLRDLASDPERWRRAALENLQDRRTMRDARRGPNRRNASRRAIERAERKLEELEIVNVITAGDDKVCPSCEDIASRGPYDIDEARGLIPAHPNCRCAFLPA